MSHAGTSVLIVEDHPFQRAVLRRLLSACGVGTIVEAGDGREALALLAQPGAAINAVMTDLDMPDMDGIELIRHIRRRGHEVAVAIFSAMDARVVASVETLTREHGLHLLGVMEKPATIERLQQILARLGELAPVSQAPELPSMRDGEILEALEQGEFRAHFQPIVSMVSGQLVAAEALARWHHPRHGIIGPDAFLPQVEAAGLVQPLTQAVLRDAAAVGQACGATAPHFKVWVNLSLSLLCDAQPLDLFARVEGGAPLAGRVAFEVTESAAMTNAAIALENLSRLRMHGFELAIDDYGTGYSSLQQLTRVPFDKLKLDRSFVTGVRLGSRQWTLLESTIDMARKLGLQSVAEGIETREDWQNLAQLGCDLAQGYLVSRPMTAQAFANWTLDFDPATLAVLA
jgi:EAL domain-containing protein (putative c-di-GMP-specific phosphodiesterase class I)/CheY-like chemotaxis protein